MISLQRFVLSALLLATLPTSHALDDILKTHTTSYKTKFYNAISKEIDILSITTKNGHIRYEGISYHVMPQTTVEAEVYEGEIIWAVLTDTVEVVSKFVVGAEKVEKYVVMWGTGDEL
jgi:hypothetical protein